MTLTRGSKLLSYEIIELIGAGGMGEVYRARDSRLKRDVAIKVLPEVFYQDTDRLLRFQREAEVLASLNHPGIAGIHELGETDGSRFLVLELVEGETLAERIRRGKIPVGEALNIARQIAEALEAAHAKGIVHRDLKPANIKWTKEGRVKVLDFGLAKIRVVPGTDLSDAPTLSAEARGTISGTPAYMSPEQATGETIDRLSDVWAFGCVLYEMLTGQQLFGGRTTTEILAGVLKSAPDFDRLPSDTPESIRKLLRRCLQRDTHDRLRDIGDARLEIAESATEKAAVAHVQTQRRPLQIVAAIALVIVGAAASWFVRRVPDLPEMRLEITTPPTPAPEAFAISPDGSMLAFVANAGGRPQLWLRSLHAEGGSPLTGTDFPSWPFWSPDSRFVGFNMDNRIYTIDIRGGAPRPLASAPFGGGSWNEEGQVLFTRGSGVLSIMSASGGEAADVTHLVNKQSAHFSPSFLPDAQHFLYFVPASDEPSGIYVDQLGNSSPRRLVDANGGAVYSSGYLLFPQNGSLLAQEFDTRRLELRGQPFSLAQGLGSGGTELPTISVSNDGKIVYRKGAEGTSKRQFVWFDRKGNELRRVTAPLDNAAGSLSDGGRQVAFSQMNAGNYDVYLLDVERGTLDRFTSDAATDAMPVFSPDRTQIAFTSNRKGARNIYRSSINTSGTPELLVENGKANVPTGWSRDGRYLLYRSGQPGAWDIWVLPLDSDGKEAGPPRPIIQTNADERDAEFSPDGKWIVYQTNKTGRPEIYIQPFPGPGPSVPISTGGGTQAQWRGDGKEIFYLGRDGRLFSVPLELSSTGLQPGEPVPLFSPGIGVVDVVNRRYYVASPDGQKFLVSAAVERPAMPITVFLNWKKR